MILELGIDFRALVKFVMTFTSTRLDESRVISFRIRNALNTPRDEWLRRTMLGMKFRDGFLLGWQVAPILRTNGHDGCITSGNVLATASYSSHVVASLSTMSWLVLWETGTLGSRVFPLDPTLIVKNNKNNASIRIEWSIRNKI